MALEARRDCFALTTGFLERQPMDLASPAQYQDDLRRDVAHASMQTSSRQVSQHGGLQWKWPDGPLWTGKKRVCCSMSPATRRTLAIV
jgi:hypothetical protein